MALIFSYMLVAAFAMIAGSVMYNAVNERNMSLRNKLMTEAFYLAEGATENAISLFATAMANYEIAPDVSSYSVTTNFATFPNASAVTEITREGSKKTITEGSTNIEVWNYVARTVLTHPQSASLPDDQKIKVTIYQSVARRLIYTFQHGVFYDNDLEMLPGADMTFFGRIHSNKDIYVGAESGVTLKIDSNYFTSVGGIYNKRKDSTAGLSGTVSIKVNQVTEEFRSMKLADGTIMDSLNANWTLGSQDRWLGTAQSSVHGTTKVNAPSVASIQPTGPYANGADVAITNNSIVKGGRTLLEGVDYPVGAVSTTNSFYNNREGRFIRMTVVDISKLANTAAEKDASGNLYPNNLPTDSNNNNMMYVTRTDAGTSEPGVKLVNGAKIYGRTGGLTVISNQPVYIQGNFNTQLDDGTAGRKPASVICDAVNLLSNNWKDSNSTSSVDSRVATETAYNCAFIAGVDNTISGRYNGGLENYPRLHEKWTNVKLKITGSFVSLWPSQVATGAWVYGNPQYTSPKREWTYDPSFNTDTGRPKGTPFVVEARKIAWWKE